MSLFVPWHACQPKWHGEQLSSYPAILNRGIWNHTQLGFTNSGPPHSGTNTRVLILFWYLKFHMIMMTSSHGNIFRVRYWPFVRGIHRSSVNSSHKGQWRGALMLSLIYARINGWIDTGKADDIRRYRAHYDVTVICLRAMLQGRLFKHPGNLYDTTTSHKDNAFFWHLTRGPAFQSKTEGIVFIMHINTYS